MKRVQISATALLFAFLFMPGASRAKEKGRMQKAWALVVKAPAEVYPRPSPGKKVLAHLGAGALMPAFDTKRSGGREWTQVRVMAPATLEVATGWTESSGLEKFPLDRYPTDAELESVLGGVYLQDAYARYTNIGRFLVHFGRKEPSLVCYIGSIFLPHTRLQIFESSGGKWVAGPYMEFLSTTMQPGVTEIEFRDLLGGGNDCLLTHEPFTHTFGSSGVNLVIRQIGPDGFKPLWQAPLELRNLTSFPAQIHILDPPEKNIGAPGTVTMGSVDFESNGRISEPVWKGKVEFHILGRDEPVNTVNVEKKCKWDGGQFAPLN
jgi:hypothetical protein